MAAYPVSLDEACRRLSGKPRIECIFQPDVGAVSRRFSLPRADVITWLKTAPAIEESGYVGQRMDMGLHLRMALKGVPGVLFISTKRTARLSDAVIQLREQQRATELLGPHN